MSVVRTAGFELVAASSPTGEDIDILGGLHPIRFPDGRHLFFIS